MNHRSFITVRECTHCDKPLVLCEHRADPRESLRKLNNKSKRVYVEDEDLPDYLIRHRASLNVGR